MNDAIKNNDWETASSFDEAAKKALYDYKYGSKDINKANEILKKTLGDTKYDFDITDDKDGDDTYKRFTLKVYSEDGNYYQVSGEHDYTDKAFFSNTKKGSRKEDKKTKEEKKERKQEAKDRKQNLRDEKKKGKQEKVEYEKYLKEREKLQNDYKKQYKVKDIRYLDEKQYDKYLKERAAIEKSFDNKLDEIWGR